MPRPAGAGASYRAVLSLPHARGLFAAAMLARLCYGLLGLPLLLTLREATGSYTVAGTAAGLFGLVSALLGPPRARLVERRPRTLMLLAALYAGMLAALTLTGELGAAPWLAITLAGVTGLFPPPVGPLMRSLWSALAVDPQQRQRALSLDTVSESTVFAVGPALGGMLIGLWSAPTALAGCAGLVLVGFGALARALHHAPAGAGTAGTAAAEAEAADGEHRAGVNAGAGGEDGPGAGPGPGAGGEDPSGARSVSQDQSSPGAGAEDCSGAGASGTEDGAGGADDEAAGAERRGGAGGRARRGPLRRGGFPGLLLLVLGTAAALALEEVAAVSRWGAGATGALLTLCSVGGVVGGLLYGHRVWHTAASRRILALGAAAVAALALTAAAPLLPVAAVAMLTLGACLDMLLITAYLLVDQLFPEGARMEAGAWVNTAYNLGCALGSALAGTLLDSRGSLTVLVAAASAAGLGTLAAVADGRFSRRPPLRPSTRAEPTSGSGPGSGSGSPSGSAVHHGDLTEAEVLELIGE